MNSLIDSYPDTLGAIVMHLSDPYQVSWGYMRADGNHYDVYYIPHSVHDGLYDADPYTTYESKFLTRQAIPTDVTVELGVFGAGDTWNLNATVCIEPGGTGKTMKIWMAQVLDYFGPAAEDIDRNTAQMGTDGVEITLAAGDCTVVPETFVINAVSQAAPADVKFFAWAQDPVFVGGWAEVYQADKVTGPIDGVFADGFETGDALAWGAISP